MAKIVNVSGTTNKFVKESLLDREIELTEQELLRLEAGSFITIEGVKLHKTDFDLGNAVIDESSSNAVISALTKKYHRVEEPATALSYGLALKKNVLFYGHGGFGKSEITMDFFEEAYKLGIIDELPFVVSLGEGTTDDDLFGGMDIKHFQNTGEVRYMIENSFMNHKYVIFEELFDAHSGTLLSLKDILTSKRFRKGKQNQPIRTEMIVGLTNIPKSEFSTDASKKAFADRFTYVYRLEWDNTGVDDYVKLFSKVFGSKFSKEYGQLANLIHNYNNSGTSDTISPRTAVNIMEAHLAGQSLKFIPGINADLITKYEKTISKGANNPVKEAQDIFESFKRVAIANNIITGNIADTNPRGIASAALVISSLRGTDEVKFNKETKKEPLLDTQESKDYIKFVSARLVSIIDSLSDEDDKEKVTAILSNLQLITINK